MSAACDIEQLVWIDADGTSHDLSLPDDSPILQGAKGRFMPEFEIVSEDVPSEAGARLRSVRAKSREVVLPVMVTAATETALRVLLRAYARFLNPLNGMGTLRSTAPDGTQRDLNAMYRQGWELVEDRGQRGGLGRTRAAVASYQRALLVFAAFDPYWYDTASTVVAVGAGSSPTFFPFFPLVLAPDVISDSEPTTVTGDVDAWPIWTVTGPFTEVTLSDTATGESLTLIYDMATGGILEIDTRPGYKTVRSVELLSGVLGADGSVVGELANLFPYLSAESNLFSLPPGVNVLGVDVEGSTADTTVQVRYRNAWLTP